MPNTEAAEREGTESHGDSDDCIVQADAEHPNPEEPAQVKTNATTHIGEETRKGMIGGIGKSLEEAKAKGWTTIMASNEKLLDELEGGAAEPRGSEGESGNHLLREICSIKYSAQNQF